jgi:hypothetical protein
MTTPQLTPEQEALARKGLDYAEKITALAREMNLPPGFVLTLFGMFAQKVIESGIQNGGEVDAERQWAIRSFMQGMGLEARVITNIRETSQPH